MHVYLYICRTQIEGQSLIEGRFPHPWGTNNISSTSRAIFVTHLGLIIFSQIGGQFCFTSRAICVFATSGANFDAHRGPFTLISQRGLQISWAVIRNTAESHMVSQHSKMHCKVQMNEWPLILWRFNCISTKEWDEPPLSFLLEIHQWRF